MISALKCLQGSGCRVAPKEQAWPPGQLRCLDGLALWCSDERASRDIAACLDDAVVAERDADTGVGAEQATLAHAHNLFAASTGMTHDRRTAADVGTGTDDDAKADTPLNGARTETAGVDAAETLVEDKSAGCQVGAEHDAACIRDADAARPDVVKHRWNRKDAFQCDRHASRLPTYLHRVEIGGQAGSERRPGNVSGERSADAAANTGHGCRGVGFAGRRS